MCLNFIIIKTFRALLDAQSIQTRTYKIPDILESTVKSTEVLNLRSLILEHIELIFWTF